MHDIRALVHARLGRKDKILYGRAARPGCVNKCPMMEQ
jgi:hypothetical protein